MALATPGSRPTSHIDYCITVTVLRVEARPSNFDADADQNQGSKVGKYHDIFDIFHNFKILPLCNFKMQF